LFPRSEREILTKNWRIEPRTLRGTLREGEIDVFFTGVKHGTAAIHMDYI
jgi:hypothetical protein